MIIVGNKHYFTNQFPCNNIRGCWGTNLYRIGDIPQALLVFRARIAKYSGASFSEPSQPFLPTPWRWDQEPKIRSQPQSCACCLCKQTGLSVQVNRLEEINETRSNCGGKERWPSPPLSTPPYWLESQHNFPGMSGDTPGVLL
jgi:hypothetical protein